VSETIEVRYVGAIPEAREGWLVQGIIYETFLEAFRRAKYLAGWYREIGLK